MRKLIYGLGALWIALLTQAGGISPAAAEPVYPWCAHYGGRDMGGAANCGFSTYQQCMATISGMGGYCAENPFYNPPQRPPRPARTR
jgi:hypothetical protein